MKSDTELRDDVEAELDFDPRFDARDIAVTVKDGVATLRGKVASYAEKSAAEEATQTVAGVRAIANEIEIELQESAKVSLRFQSDAAEKAVQNLWGVKGVVNEIRLRTPPVTTVSDVKTKIEDAFRRHAQLDADAVHVSLEDGALILSGEVRSLRERNDAEAAAWAAPGIRKVENRIHVQL